MDTVDIIEKNSVIQSRFQAQKEALSRYVEERDALERQLEQCQEASVSFVKQLESHIKRLDERISAITANRDEDFYVLDTAQYLDEYDQLLQTPVKVAFMNNSVDTKTAETKSALVRRFLLSCQEFNDQYYEELEISDNEFEECPECGHREFANSHDTDVSICVNCGFQVALPENGSSYGDAERINLSVKYSYDKKTHFINCINQYQGKQTCILEDSMLAEIEKEIDKYNLKTSGTTRREQYDKVQKTHILLFLKELRFTKQYENLNLIYHRITEKPLDDISHLTEKLVQDFTTFLELYDRKYANVLERKNFNYQYVLYQLLSKYRHKCDMSDFNVLKTVDRKTQHDDICMKIFQELQWPHTPLF
jgi:hypothetical protein